MTLCSTLGAIVLTPLLTQGLAGQYVPVDGWALFSDTLRIVLIPVAGGLALHHLFPRAVKAMLPLSPVISVVAIASGETNQALMPAEGFGRVRG